LAAILVACESPLNLEGVESRKAVPVRRSDLFQEAASNGNALVVVGNHGLVLRSADDGATWARQELAGWPSLIDLAACPDGQLAALATEGEVLVSTDDGQTWVPHPIETEESPQGITCDPRNRLWVVGSFSTIIVSADGGSTWDDRSIGDDTILTTVQFLDDQNGVIFGEFGTTLQTSDGGETWLLKEPIPNEFYTQDALFTDISTGWVAGLAGQIQYTADGGESWSLEKTPTLAPVYSLTMVGRDIYAVGGEGVVLRRVGDQWTLVDHGKSIRLLLRVAQPVGNDRLLIGGAAGALYVVPTGTSPAPSAPQA